MPIEPAARAEPPDDAPAPRAAYAFVPRPFGREIRFTLHDDRLEIDDQRRTVKIPLAQIEMARLTFEPRSAMTRGFRCKLISAGRRSTSFTNLSWRSMTQLDNDRQAYRAFVTALLPAIARANPRCRFVGGRTPAAWGLLVAASIVMLGGVIYVAAAAAPGMGVGAALLTLAFAAALAWVVVEMVTRNRPRRFAAEAPPRDLLP